MALALLCYRLGDITQIKLLIPNTAKLQCKNAEEQRDPYQKELSGPGTVRLCGFLGSL